MPLKKPPKGTQSQYAGSVKGRTQKNKKWKKGKNITKALSKILF